MNNLNNKEYNLELLSDPKFYLENFTKIKTKEGKGLVPFILKPAQLDLFNTIKKHNRVMITKARQIGFCGHPDTEVLTNDLKWITLNNINEGQKIISIDEFPKAGRGKKRKMTESVVEKKFIVFDIAYKIKMDNGEELIFTGEHKLLSKKYKSSTETVWKKVCNMDIGDEIRYITKRWGKGDYEDGWFGGLIDGEGCLRIKTGAELCVSQVSGPVWNRVLDYVNKNKYNYRIDIDKRLPGETSKLGSQEVNKLVISRMNEIFHIIGKTRPERFINNKWWQGRATPNEGWSKIISIEKLEKQKMIDLQTSARTFIANGFISHNSTSITGWLYHKTITTSGVTSALIGYNNDLTAELLDKIKTFYRTTPDALKPTIHYNTKFEISFPKVDSKILVLPSTENVGRGYTINYALCLSGDTEVIMRDFTSKKIKDIQIGEEVINGKGGFSKVSNVFKKNNDKKLLSIVSYGSRPLVLTEDHLILTREFITGRPVWKKASELSKKDYLAYPYFQCRSRAKEIEIPEIKDRATNKVRLTNRKIETTPEFGPFIGWYLAKWRLKNTPGMNQGGGYWKRGKFYYWARISSISEAPSQEYVYDISLEGEPHSFLTHAGVVHNCTEIPFWEKAEEKMMTLEASVPINGKIIIESSPGSVGDLFHRMWVSDNDYVKKEYGWWWNYSFEEIEIIKRRMNNPRKFANNYSLEFLTSGRSVFDADTLRKPRKNILKVGDTVKLHDGTEHIVREEDGFRIYKPPRQGGVYCLGNDNAEGVTGGDYSVITIFDRSNGEEVGFWRGHTPPDKLAKILNKWGRHYNNALAVVESEAHGNVVINCLKQLLYPSIYFRPAKFDTLSNPWSEKMGWKTTKLTRPILIDEFESAVRDGLLLIHSKEIVDEMVVFVFNDANNMVALEGYHDDCIFSAGLSYQGFKVMSATTPTQLNYTAYLPPMGY